MQGPSSLWPLSGVSRVLRGLSRRDSGANRYPATPDSKQDLSVHFPSHLQCLASGASQPQGGAPPVCSP